MEYTLRPYQSTAVEKAVSFFKDPKIKHNSIMMLPTGSGKSLIIAAIVKELDEPTLIFQPSKEILEQNFDKLQSYGFQASIYSASAGQKIISNITFATIGSCINKIEYFRRFKYIIIDECHFVNAKGGMYEKFISEMGVKVLGLTATPYRLTTDGFGGSILKFITRTRPRIFKDVLYYVQNKDLFDAGYLSKLDYINFGGFDQSQIKQNSTGADFDDNSLQRYFDSINHQQRIFDVIKDIQESRRGILCFTKFIKEAEYMKFLVDGSEIVIGDTPKKERERIAKEFRAGKIKVVFVVGCWVTGFDYPELDTIIMARPTMSLALYYQMIGRGIRPHPNKEYSLIIDLCDNFSKFGKVEDLWLHENNGKPFIGSNNRQLTNAYFTEDKPIEAEKDKVYLMPFGKYKNVPITEVAEKDLGYLKWLKKEIELKYELKTQVNKYVE